MDRRSYRDISDEEAMEFIQNCKLKYVWSSDPNDPCNECEFNNFCKGKFYRKNPNQFNYDLKELKRMIFRKYLAENPVSGDMPSAEEQKKEEEISYI